MKIARVAEARKIFRNAGFTLVELMIVIAIIGVLLGIGISQYSNLSKDTKLKRAKADVKLICDAVRSYNRQERKKFYQVKDINLLLGRHIQKLPKDPWNRPYEADGTYIFSLGEDGIKGKRIEYVDKFGATKTGSLDDYQKNGASVVAEYQSDDVKMKYERDSIVGNPTFIATQNSDGIETPGSWKLNPEYDPQNKENTKNVVTIDRSNTTSGGNSVIIK